MEREIKTRAQMFGQHLARIRKEKGYSRQQLADMLGVSVQSFGAYERGLQFPTLEKLFRLADFLKVAIADLTGESNNFIDEQILNYRFKRALMLAEKFGAFSPIEDDDGCITFFTSAKVQFNPDDNAVTFGTPDVIRFKNQMDFVKVMEQAEEKAAYEQIALNQAFRKIVFKEK